VAVFVFLFGAAAASGHSAVAPPQVLGPRTTTSEQPVYRFKSAGAIGFRCAFDSMVLHRCGARYSEGLAVGLHVLRVRAVGRGGKLSRLVTVRVRVRPLPTPPTLRADATVAVPRWPGVPAVAAGSIWIPSAGTGTVVRMDPETRAVTATIQAVAPALERPRCDTFEACGYVNATLVAGADLWVSCDSCAELVRIDTATNEVVRRFAVAPRPGGLASGGGFLWAFHTLDSTVSRIDPQSGAVTEVRIPGLEGAGIAFSRGMLWLLSSVRPGFVLRVDPQTFAVTARIELDPSGLQHPLKEAWGLVGDDERLWAANPNYNSVTEVDPATATVERRVRGTSDSPMDQPFALALAGAEVWVATRSGVVRIDERTGEVTGSIGLPSAGSGLIEIAYGFGAAWVTHYERGTLTRVAPERSHANAFFTARQPGRRTCGLRVARPSFAPSVIPGEGWLSAGASRSRGDPARRRVAGSG
jgi:glutamine cyclotransferase